MAFQFKGAESVVHVIILLFIGTSINTVISNADTAKNTEQGYKIDSASVL